MRPDRMLLWVLCGAWCLSACSRPAETPLNVCMEATMVGQRPLPSDFKGKTLTPEEARVTVRAGTVSDNDGDFLRLRVPEGADSVALVVEGSGANIVAAASLLSPTGKLVWDFFEDIAVNMTSPDDDPYTLLLPSNTAVTLEPGDWYLNLITDAPQGKEVSVRAVYKQSDEEGEALGELDLNLFFVGVKSINAQTAPEDPNFQGVLANVEAIFAGAGLRFGSIEYIDVPEDIARAFRVTTVHNGELEELFKLSEGRTERALNFFFVPDLEGAANGFSLLGISGGVPGPPGIHGTAKSGVAVNMSDYVEDPSSIEVIMAHEAGHFLGLFHTTERNGLALDPEGVTGFDPLCDTPVCPDGLDSNANLTLSVPECTVRDSANLMFSLAGRDSRALTPSQGQILRNNFLVR